MLQTADALKKRLDEEEKSRYENGQTMKASAQGAYMEEYKKTMSPSVYALKLMLPYTPASMQRMLGLFLKFLEFQYTMKHFYGFGSEKSPSDALTALKDLMSPEEQDMMEQMEMMTL